MNQADKNILNIIEEIVTGNDFFLIDIIIRGTPNFKVIEVFIDSEGIISAENCADISHKIKSKLDGLFLNDFNYRLDVSSPGVDRPLKFLKQFPKHINRNFEIKYKSGDDNKIFKGKLLNVDGSILSFEVDKKEYLINFNQIIKAKVIISFS